MNNSNSTILHNITPEDLVKLIRESVQKEISIIQSTQTEVKYFTREETATCLRISLPTLREYEKRGLIKRSGIGDRVLFDVEEIQRAVKEAPGWKYSRSNWNQG